MTGFLGMNDQQPQNDSQQRMKRGMDMLQGGATVQENEDGSFMVPSQTSADKFYEVRVLGERMVCTCPDFEYRQIEACKHIHLVKFTLSVKYLKDEPKPKVFAEDAIPCDKCGSPTGRPCISKCRTTFGPWQQLVILPGDEYDTNEETHPKAPEHLRSIR